MKLSQQKLRRMIKEELADIAGGPTPAADQRNVWFEVKFEGGRLEFDYGEVQVHNDKENTVLHVPPSAILELAKKLPEAEAPEQEPPGEITVTQSQVDALEQADQLLRKRGRTGGDLTKLQKQDRRWKLGL